jgi:hypothetical protein
MWPRQGRGNEVSGAAMSRALRVSSSEGEDTMPRTFLSTADHEPDDPDPDHHLWRNGRLWWIAFTVHLPGWQKERVRASLGTADLREARRRRDELLRLYPEQKGCALSLRIAGRPFRTEPAPRMPGAEGCAA